MAQQKTVDLEIFEGPNIYARHPVIRYQFEYENIETVINVGFVPVFYKLLDLGGISAPSDLLTITDKPEKMLATLFAWSTVGLQRLSGCSIPDGCVEPVPGTNRWVCAIPFSQLEIGRAASIKVFLVINQFLEKEDLSAIGLEFIQSLRDTLVDLKELYQKLEPGTPEAEFIEIAHQRGIPWRRFSHEKPIMQFGYGKFRKSCNRTILQIESQIASEMANNKELTSMVLADAGLPVPQQVVVRLRSAAKEAAQKIGFPVAIKPLYGLKGFGVSPNVTGPDQMDDALDKAARYDKPVIVEQHIEGDDYRLQVTGGKLEFGILRTRAMVTGDGKNTVADLIEEVNKAPWRKDAGGKLVYGIQKTPDSTRILERQGYGWDSIADKDVDVFLQDVANSSQGGDYEMITHTIHPENAAMAVRAAEAVGLHIAGVDFITNDISKPYWETGGAICEVNLMPGIDGAAPSPDQPLYQFEKAFDLIFPEQDFNAIPTVAVLGVDQEKSVKWLKEIFDLYDLQIGLKIDMEAEVNGSPLVGIKSSCDASRSILWNPSVEAAIIMENPDSVRKEGLGYSQIDCVIFEKMPCYHDGHEAVDVANLFANIADKAVLYNADDPALCDWIKDVPSQLCIPVSGDKLPDHVASNPELSSLYDTLDENEKLPFLLAVESVRIMGNMKRDAGKVID